MKLYGALEAGGTKMVLAVADEQGKILERVSLPTRAPDETMQQMIGYFREKQISALGIGCFGPLDLNTESETYGNIPATPKLTWRNYPILTVFRKALCVPVGLDTDVNGAAMAEMMIKIQSTVKRRN